MATTGVAGVVTSVVTESGTVFLGFLPTLLASTTSVFFSILLTQEPISAFFRGRQNPATLP